MSLRPRWRVRVTPLPAAAVVGTGTIATALATATAGRLESGCWLRACAGEGWLLVLGDAVDLPWVDGARYLGWESGVLVPTTMDVVPSPRFVRAAVGDVGPSELVAFLPGALLVTPAPRRRADPTRLQ